MLVSYNSNGQRGSKGMGRRWTDWNIYRTSTGFVKRKPIPIEVASKDRSLDQGSRGPKKKVEIKSEVIWPSTIAMWVGEDRNAGQMNGTGILHIVGRGSHLWRVEWGMGGVLIIKLENMTLKAWKENKKNQPILCRIRGAGGIHKTDVTGWKTWSSRSKCQAADALKCFDMSGAVTGVRLMPQFFWTEEAVDVRTGYL